MRVPLGRRPQGLWETGGGVRGSREREMWSRRRAKGTEKAAPLLPLGSEYFSTGTVPRFVELC